MDHGIFMSYRRADTSGYAGRISGDLARHFGRPVVFQDIDAIEAGADFVHALEQAIARARVCIVLIGDTWLSAQSATGGRRLDAADDHVRREIELALRQPGLRVLPVLVEGARMPAAEALPPSLRPLARLQAIELSDSRWEHDLGRLIGALAASGIAPPRGTRVPGWLWGLVGLLTAALLLLAVLCWRVGAGPPVEDFTGLWYLPNGSYWSVREGDDGAGLWVEETHHESQQVWKRGPGQVDGREITAALELVFEREPFRYVHELRLSGDRASLVGTVRRSDRKTGRALVLTRARP